SRSASELEDALRRAEKTVHPRPRKLAQGATEHRLREGGVVVVCERIEAVQRSTSHGARRRHFHESPRAVRGLRRPAVYLPFQATLRRTRRTASQQAKAACEAAIPVGRVSPSPVRLSGSTIWASHDSPIAARSAGRSQSSTST